MEENIESAFPLMYRRALKDKLEVSMLLLVCNPFACFCLDATDCMRQSLACLYIDRRERMAYQECQYPTGPQGVCCRR